MKIRIESIIDQMSPEVRKQAEHEASSRGTTLEKFVENQLAVQLTDDELSLRAARIRADGWDVRTDGRGGGVGVSGTIRGRFGRG